ncbi:MAG: hypothetical protein P4M02_07415, partial [Clostridia bacterium]|nr:hypothetical protein [Clostridia bacterium]
MTEQFRMPDTAVEATPELMARIKKVNEDAFALHLGVLPALFLNAKVEKQGRTLFDKHYKANSYSRNYYNVIAYNLLGLTRDGTYGAGHVSTKLISGAVRSWPANGSSIASLLG